jgi:hypothetical protein
VVDLTRRDREAGGCLLACTDLFRERRFKIVLTKIIILPNFYEKEILAEEKGLTRKRLLVEIMVKDIAEGYMEKLPLKSRVKILALIILFRNPIKNVNISERELGGPGMAKYFPGQDGGLRKLVFKEIQAVRGMRFSNLENDLFEKILRLANFQIELNFEGLADKRYGRVKLGLLAMELI